MSLFGNISQKVRISSDTTAEKHILNEIVAKQFVAFSLERGATIHQESYRGHFRSGSVDDFLKAFNAAFDNKFCLIFVSKDTWCMLRSTEVQGVPAFLYMNTQSNDKTKYNFCLTSFEKTDIIHFNKLCKELLMDCKEVNSVFMYTSSPTDGNDFTNIGEIHAPFVRDNYDDIAIQAFDNVCQNLLTNGNHGKLVILSGPPGTGKSYFIRGLIEHLSKSSMCIFLPAKLITELDGPSMIPLLLQHRSKEVWDEDEEEYVRKPSRPIVFIAEDCDNYLVPREGADSSLMSGLLNYTDGIMSDLLNIRFIATTNAPHLEIDAALKRPGRLLTHCFIGDLSPQKANQVYQKLTKGDGKEVFTKPISLAQVYAKVNNMEVYDPLLEEQRKHKVGFGG